MTLLRHACTAVAIAATPLALSAQETERCSLIRSDETQLLQVQVRPGVYNRFVGGNVNIICPAKELRLRSDSLEWYGEEGRIFLIGHVRYNEPKLALTSDFLTYYQTDERMIANGSVVATLPSGSKLTGPTAEYFRAIPGARPAARMVARGRPTITILDRDTTPPIAPPTVVVANNVTMVGDSLVYAGGQVVVTREDLVARGDSMDLDSERELTVLMRGPSIEGKRDRPYELRGQRIELMGREKKLHRVLAMGFASATSQDMILASDTIALSVERDQLQRAVAWGPGRARAASAQQTITADSIDVLMPDQRVREMHAVRGAAAEGKPDSTRFRAEAMDWMRGDTIVAHFDTMAADSSRARLKALVAEGAARSFYHMPPADTSMRRPAINYVTGREITVSFNQQRRVASVTVVQRASGVYAEPKPQAAAAPADSTRPPAAPAAAGPPAATRPPTTRPPRPK